MVLETFKIKFQIIYRINFTHFCFVFFLPSKNTQDYTIRPITDDAGIDKIYSHTDIKQEEQNDKEPFETDDIKCVSLEELLEFENKSFSPPLNWPSNAMEMDELSNNDAPNDIALSGNRSDEKTPYDPIYDSMTPPPLIGYQGGQLLIGGCYRLDNVANACDKIQLDNNDKARASKFGPLFDFNDKDSDFSSGPPSLASDDSDELSTDNGCAETVSDDGGVDDWSS